MGQLISRGYRNVGFGQLSKMASKERAKNAFVKQRKQAKDHQQTGDLHKNLKDVRRIAIVSEQKQLFILLCMRIRTRQNHFGSRL